MRIRCVKGSIFDIVEVEGVQDVLVTGDGGDPLMVAVTIDRGICVSHKNMPDFETFMSVYRGRQGSSGNDRHQLAEASLSGG